jgi:hypothetical protein
VDDSATTREVIVCQTQTLFCSNPLSLTWCIHQNILIQIRDELQYFINQCKADGSAASKTMSSAYLLFPQFPLLHCMKEWLTKYHFPHHSPHMYRPFTNPQQSIA